MVARQLHWKQPAGVLVTAAAHPAVPVEMEDARASGRENCLLRNITREALKRENCFQQAGASLSSGKNTGLMVEERRAANSGSRPHGQPRRESQAHQRTPSRTERSPLGVPRALLLHRLQNGFSSSLAGAPPSRLEVPPVTQHSGQSSQRRPRQ